MIDGFPIPDLDFDDDDSEGVIGTPMAAIPSLSHSLTEEEYDALCVNNGLYLQSSTPLRCTSNSAVYAAFSDDDKKRYAVKITEFKKRVKEEYFRRAKLGDSPFLVKSIAMVESPTKALLQMELCESGDLTEYKLTEEVDVWKLIHDIGSGLLLLHESKLMHLDISPGNILVSGEEDYNLPFFKLADFGTVLEVGSFSEGDEGAGPYVSPEALAYPCGKYEVYEATDIFSFGVVLLEVITHQNAPRGGCEGYAKIRRDELFIGSNGYKPDLSSCSEELINLVNSMLSSDPGKRPTSADLVNISKNVLGLEN